METLNTTNTVQLGYTHKKLRLNKNALRHYSKLNKGYLFRLIFLTWNNKYCKRLYIFFLHEYNFLSYTIHHGCHPRLGPTLLGYNSSAPGLHGGWGCQVRIKPRTGHQQSSVLPMSHVTPYQPCHTPIITIRNTGTVFKKVFFRFSSNNANFSYEGKKMLC